MMVPGLLEGWAALLALQVRISAALEQDETLMSVLLAAPNPCTLTSCDGKSCEIEYEACRCWGVDAPASPASCCLEEDERGWDQEGGLPATGEACVRTWSIET
jgi:hypothetical protein